MKRSFKQPSGMLAFTVIAVGQFVSLLGSGMTGFGIGIWAWQETGQATPLALAGFFFMAPMILLSPIAGAIVDRANRKLVMMLSDLAAGLMTLVLLILLAMGRLEIWHIYLTNFFSGAFQAFQFPAFSAAITTMLSKEQYGRTNGLDLPCYGRVGRLCGRGGLSRPRRPECRGHSPPS